jgi:Asp-tRNA(Asn)/Glu-tRNA(Gln) amidotransferase A subunit family amidase
MLEPHVRPANVTIVNHARSHALRWLETILGRSAQAADGVSLEVLEQAAIGATYTESQVAEAYDIHMQLGAAIHEWFTPNTILVTPVTHHGPNKLGEQDPLGMGLFCAPYSFSGQPTMSIPVGFRHDGTPIGIQLVGPRGADGALLDVAALLEAAGVATFTPRE